VVFTRLCGQADAPVLRAGPMKAGMPYARVRNLVVGPNDRDALRAGTEFGCWAK
jgi:hypothetical protein